MRNNLKKIHLEKGEVEILDRGKIKLHVYSTNDPLNDIVFLFQKGDRCAILEKPNFTDNIREFEDYIGSIGLTVDGVLAVHHMSGSFLPDVRRYATPASDDYCRKGIKKAIANNFAKVFAGAFETAIPETTDFINDREVLIAGVTFWMIPAGEAFDVEIPEANLFYTHRIGHDVHSIIDSPDQAKMLIKKLDCFVRKGYDLALSSHYRPETVKELRTKIAYLEKLIQIAERAESANHFKLLMKTTFPGYYGENYLGMTARALFGAAG